MRALRARIRALGHMLWCFLPWKLGETHVEVVVNHRKEYLLVACNCGRIFYVVDDPDKRAIVEHMVGLMASSNIKIP